MSVEPLTHLLDRLCRGDSVAAERAFLAFEPYLRKVVRRMITLQLRPKFDSADVVQSIWGDLCGRFPNGAWRFANSNQLRAFLVQATRHRFIDRARRYRAAVDREQAFPHAELAQIATARQAEPGEAIEADDLWGSMLALSSPEHHEILRLKRQGLRLQEIAARTGFHEGSIRRILRRLARDLASRDSS
jgi:RNA polymerase sigma-70 factor (ECF subfamily)